MGSRTLYLVRHGQYRMDPDEPKSGTLTALGRRQALRTGRRLRGIPITAVYHSDIVRAVETVKLIARYFPDQRLRSTALLRETLPPTPGAVLGGQRISRADKAEMRVQCERAFDRFFRVARRGEHHEVLVTHGNLIRYLVRRALGDDPRKWYRYGIYQCSITTVQIESRALGPMLIGFNDIGHLPDPMQTML